MALDNLAAAELMATCWQGLGVVPFCRRCGILLTAATGNTNNENFIISTFEILQLRTPSPHFQKKQRTQNERRNGNEQIL